MSEILVNPAAPPPEPSVQAGRTPNRAVPAAVAQVNASGVLGQDREVTFSVDQATKMPLIKVIDTNTDEVITQWPPEYLLALAAETKAQSESDQTTNR